jgi:hypothetical protein
MRAAVGVFAGLCFFVALGDALYENHRQRVAVERLGDRDRCEGEEALRRICYAQQEEDLRRLSQCVLGRPLDQSTGLEVRGQEVNFYPGPDGGIQSVANVLPDGGWECLPR